jgi:glycosyltransferase involved in cell wall biosynthesis
MPLRRTSEIGKKEFRMDDNQSLYESNNKEQDIKYSPLVSIITVVLNSVQYLEACIESVLDQGYPHIEHVFVDGGSTDGTVDILSRYSAKYPERIRFISEPDKGVSDADNKGLRMAKGEIIGLIGSDDTYEPGAIQVVVEFFRANPHAYFVFGDCNLIDEKGEIFRRARPRDFNLKRALNVICDVPGTSTFCKREVFEQIGQFSDAGVTAAADFDFVIRAAKVFQIHRIEEVLSNFRYHKLSLSGSLWEHYKVTSRALYICNRRHGGSIFSWQFVRYFIILAIDWLRPILHPIYPFIAKIGDKYRYRWMVGQRS